MEPSAPQANHLSSALKSAADTARTQLQLSEQQLNSMPELSFEVTKTLNKWPHKKVSRILKLTTESIANIRSGDASQAPSSSFSYDRIIKVVMTDLRTFVIDYKGAGHKYLYQSPVALQIVQEIEARQRLLESSRKWRETLRLHQQFIYKFNDPSPQTRTAALDIAGVEASKNTATADSASSSSLESGTSPETTAIARDRSLSSLLLEGTKAPHGTPETPPWVKSSPVKERLARQSVRHSGQFSGPFHSNSSSALTPATDSGSPAIEEPSSSEEAEIIPTSRPRSLPKRVRLSTVTTHRAKKMNSILGQDDFSRIDAAVLMVLKNQQYEEARVLKHFLDNFSVLEKNPVTLQMNVRNFMDQLKYRLLTPESRTKFQFDRIVLQSKNQEQLESFVEVSIERIVIGPVFEKIMSAILRSNSKVDATLTRTMDALKAKSQQDLHIPSRYISRTEFQFAVLELRDLTREMLPADKMAVVLRCMQAIVSTIKQECAVVDSDNSSGDVLDIGADDLLPILIFVVVQSGIYSIDSQCQYMWSLAAPDDLRGEKGYYLTMLSSAVDYLKDQAPS
eukprot:TRINITY_DN3114_c0_g1_i2.p2 TRINITY_DN3114_c0_g1~~TRINITY_DN3114_c0_g1_i2.p2  ORF type:complete len:566 (-),score=82.47 TRINITY_DN3114_c0_g1_i2:2898-4595(-)